MSPKISICVPNLNTRPYLPERFETIFNQTFQDWELIVCDSYSDDGAWEYIQGLAAREPRMRISQVPRNGIYAGFNECIKLAKGEFIYIATSDDTMAPDCLEKMLSALEAHPECDLAHCTLRAIGDGADEMNQGWRSTLPFGTSSGGWIDRPHVRRAPFDGMLHLCGDTVYISITQLLIRHSLFDKIGLFENRWGSIGDFHWCMRAGLVANTIHVPDTWGGWRLHSIQATGKSGYGTWEHRQKIEEMIDDALRSVKKLLPIKLNTQLNAQWRNYFLARWSFQRKFDQLPTRLSRSFFLVKEMLTASSIAWCFCGRRLKGVHGWNESPGRVVSRWLASTGISESIIAA